MNQQCKGKRMEKDLQYVIQEGDTLEQICAAIYARDQVAPQIAAFNQLEKGAPLIPGNRLQLPLGVFYILDHKPADAPPPSLARTLHIGMARALQVIEYVVQDDEGDPLPNKKYCLLVEGEEYHGYLDEKGLLTQRIPFHAVSGNAQVWFDESNDDSIVEIQISFEKISADKMDDESALMRLVNLGYYRGQEPDASTPQARRAISRFQNDYDLPATGELDEATRAMLKKIHGD